MASLTTPSRDAVNKADRSRPWRACGRRCCAARSLKTLTKNSLSLSASLRGQNFAFEGFVSAAADGAGMGKDKDKIKISKKKEKGVRNAPSAHPLPARASPPAPLSALGRPLSLSLFAPLCASPPLCAHHRRRLTPKHRATVHPGRCAA